MTEQEVAAYKEQMFGQSSTHSPAPDVVPDNNTPPVDNPTSDLPPADTPVDTPPTTDAPPTIDYNSYVKAELGFETVEEAKATIAELRALKETAPKPLEFANDESKKVFELIQAGKMKEVKAIYDLQEKLETAENLTPAEAIKLHIEQTNKHYKKADVEDVFEEKYNFPEKPEQGLTEDDDVFAAREERYKSTVEKINRKIERDAVTAKEELAKLKSEIKLPELPQTNNPQLDAFNAYQDSITQAQEGHKVLTESLSKVSEKDVNQTFSFNDEASKIKFDVSYQGDKQGAEQAKISAANYMDFLNQNYYNEDGSPLTNKLVSDIHFLQNKDKIITEMIKQAVNETRAAMLRSQKNIGDGIQRNFNVVAPDAIQTLKEQVFGKTG